MTDLGSEQLKTGARTRRSQRLALSVPVVAYRPPKRGLPFYEGTFTLVVNAHGALITLAAKVASEERLFLKNEFTGEEQECRVVYIAKQQLGPTEVGIEFAHPEPNFWNIAYPPTDWASCR